MTTLPLPAAIAAIFALLAVPTGATAQSQGFVPLRSPPPPPQSVVHGSFHGDFHNGFHHRFHGGGFLLIPETQVVHDVVVVHEQPAEPPAPPPPPRPPREPWAMGRTYASLPGSCMKMVEKAASYFYCGGDWYRQIGARSYKAVAKPI